MSTLSLWMTRKLRPKRNVGPHVMGDDIAPIRCAQNLGYLSLKGGRLTRRPKEEGFFTRLGRTAF